ncbi:MAG TPA: adenylate/guanylate cyclase domain-containing protein [Anaerolineaceae bacterium]|nr:adenylate/guanylate cyclase domain-containing protein [Anaerolineaceae bacterium]HNS36255.1 adenylate/guanylate cyclase domain-containing protein [Anaerolineaceae bacterium]
MDEIRQLEEAIAALEAQRPVLGDAVVELALDSMLQKLATLKAGQGEAEHEAQQRKMVTVLFADLSGFTALAEQMDAEDITDLMNALWERLDRIITQRRGRIDKHIGDAIMAVWGAEAAQEDDAEQAIRAALDMQAELMRLNNNNEIPGLKALPDEQTIAMRIGINTGAALLGVVGTTGEITAIGDTVNTASRLQNAAPLNGIIISHDTFRHVRGLFRVRALEPLALKGKAEPVAVYLVEKARPHAFRLATRGFEDLDTRMIGRGEELEQLQADYMEGLNEQNPRMVTIIGEAGVGKSRLLYEFSSWLELQNHLTAAFKIRATQQTSSVPGLLIRQLLTTQLEIRESDPAEVIIARLAHGLEKAPGSEVPLNNRALILGTWAGFDLPDDNGFIGLIGARQLRDRGMIHLAELLSASAAEVPLALLLEDLQWADEQSLDAIEFIQRACAHVPLFTICVARPGFLERRPDWPSLCSTMLELRPLNENESRTLIQEILQRAQQIPEALCSLIIQRSEGNPFYIEELIKMLIEEGVIQIREQEWLIDATRLEMLPIPATLTGVLQARLDSLPASEKLALQRASILGRIFWDRAVAQLGKTEDRPEQDEAVQKPLNGLRNRRLIYRRDKPAFEGTNEFIFVHVLLRDVAYESVLKRERRHYHAEAARWLGQTARAAGRADEYAVLIAEHYEQAGEMLSAQEWYERAAGSASLRYANAEARRCLTHALALTPANDPHHSYDLRLAREKVLNLLGDRGAQLEDLNALEEIANALGDPRRQAEVALRRAHYAEITGDYGEAAAHASRAIRLAQAGGDARLETAGHLQHGQTLRRQGLYEAAGEEFEIALKQAEALGMTAIEAECLHSLGKLSFHQGNYAAASDYYARTRVIHEQNRDLQGVGAVLNSLGIVADSQGDYPTATQYYTEALGVFRKIGDLWGQGLAYNNLGIVSGEVGNLSDARDYYSQALQICIQTNDRYGEGMAYNNLGIIADALGDYGGAQRYYEHGLKIMRETGGRQGEGVVLASYGLLMVHAGNANGALTLSEQALEIADELGEQRVAGYALTNQGHALLLMGKNAEALAAYHRAAMIRQELGDLTVAIESQAGEVRCLDQLGHSQEALTLTETILKHLETNTLDGVEEPGRVYLTCYDVLHAHQDERAASVLKTAQENLIGKANRISDVESRRGFLENVAVHRQIMTLFTGQGDAA